MSNVADLKSTRRLHAEKSLLLPSETSPNSIERCPLALQKCTSSTSSKRKHISSEKCNGVEKKPKTSFESEYFCRDKCEDTITPKVSTWESNFYFKPVINGKTSHKTIAKAGKAPAAGPSTRKTPRRKTDTKDNGYNLTSHLKTSSVAKIPMPIEKPGYFDNLDELPAFFEGMPCRNMDMNPYFRLISSYLGPNKSQKFVGEDEHKMLVGCVADIVACNEVSLQHPVNRVIRSCLQAHHSSFGCSSATLLSMFCFWYRALLKLQDESNNIATLISELQEILESTIESLTPITSSLYAKVKDCLTGLNQIVDSNSMCISPLRISSDELQRIKQLVRCMGHDNDFLADLLATAWSNQIGETSSSSEEALRFDISQISTLPVNCLPSYSKVVDGILLQTSHENVEVLIRWQKRNIRTLLINGNLTPSFMHKGVNLSKNLEKANAHNDSSAIKSHWISETLATLKQLGVPLILVSGKVDNDFSTHLNLSEICAVGNTRINILEHIASCTGAAVASYVSDCDELNVATCLSVSIEDTCYVVGKKDSLADFYITIHLPSSYQTILICHPVVGYLSCLEHNFWHLAHRLAHASNTDKVLPGRCQTEKYVIGVLQSIATADSASLLAKQAILHGFRNFIETVETKFCDDSYSTGDADKCENQVFDDYLSKIESWRSALRLACLIAQTDRVIITGDLSGYKKGTVDTSSAFLGII